ncbi:hypothetical protein BDZ97DRAFT_1656039, partial [Flammula alnicola]
TTRGTNSSRCNYLLISISGYIPSQLNGFLVQIVLETFGALFLGILGACLNTPPFKEITWSSEMRKHKIDEMDSRLGFASYVNRGKQIFSKPVTASKRAQ